MFVTIFRGTQKAGLGLHEKRFSQLDSAAAQMSEECICIHVRLITSSDHVLFILQGAKGFPGLAGNDGAQGARGGPGPRGAQGDRGPIGSQVKPTVRFCTDTSLV